MWHLVVDLGQSLLLDIKIITLVSLVINLDGNVLLTDPMSKSREREVKHKLVNLILIYFISNNAFYINENVTYSYDLRCK